MREVVEKVDDMIIACLTLIGFRDMLQNRQLVH